MLRTDMSAVIACLRHALSYGFLALSRHTACRYRFYVVVYAAAPLLRRQRARCAAATLTLRQHATLLRAED